MKSIGIKVIMRALQALLLTLVSIASQAEVESTTYILTDHLGSPILATDENGDTLWREDYQPYGTQMINEDGDNSVGFTGHKDDKALGVTYMQGRWYHQEMGRFLAIDPVGFVEGNPASFNRYAYANSNPYLFVDPDGNQSSYTHIGPYLRAQYRRGELLAWQMMGKNYLEEGAYAVLGGALGKIAGKAIISRIKYTSNVTNSGRSVGAMARREYQAASYHGKVGNAVKSKAPTNGQNALDMSVQVKGTSPRRVGIDYETGEFAVFDQTSSGIFHGHVRSWKDLTSQMQNALRNTGMVDRKGNILGGGQ